MNTQIINFLISVDREINDLHIETHEIVEGMVYGVSFRDMTIRQFNNFFEILLNGRFKIIKIGSLSNNLFIKIEYKHEKAGN